MISVAAIVTGTACSGRGDAAEVNGSAITFGDLDRMLDSFADAQRVSVDPATRTLPASQARNLLGVLVEERAIEGFLADNGEAISQADRDGVMSSVPPGDPSRDLPDEVLPYFIEAQAAVAARARVAAPAAAELRSRYEAGPGSVGILCARQMVFTSAAAARAAVDRLAAGESFESVAAHASPLPSQATSSVGQVPLDDGGVCFNLRALARIVRPGDLDAALDATPGEVVGPVLTSADAQVYVVEPWDAVASMVTDIYDQGGGELMWNAYLASADVEVASRYGQWDPLSGTIIELR